MIALLSRCRMYATPGGHRPANEIPASCPKAGNTAVYRKKGAE